MAAESVSTETEETSGRSESDLAEADVFAFAPTTARTTRHSPQEPILPRPRRWSPAFSLQSPRTMALAIVVAAAVIGGAWWILSGASDQPKRLAVSFPAEGSSVYRMGASLDWRSDSRRLDWEVHTEFEGILTLRTLSKDAAGARLRAILDLSTLVVNDRPVFRPPTMRGRLRAASDGSLRQGDYLELPQPSAPIMLVATGLAPVLPDLPVEPGDSWSDKLKVRMGRDRLEGPARSQFLRYEKLEGVETAVLQGTREFKIDGARPRPGKGTLRVDQTAWVNPDTGAVLKMTATVRFSFRTRSAVLDGWDRYELNAV